MLLYIIIFMLNDTYKNKALLLKISYVRDELYGSK